MSTGRFAVWLISVYANNDSGSGGNCLCYAITPGVEFPPDPKAVAETTLIGDCFRALNYMVLIAEADFLAADALTISPLSQFVDTLISADHRKAIADQIDALGGICRSYT